MTADWSKLEAKRAIESLRFGTPPVGRVRDFTVGRDAQLHQLEQTIGGESKAGAMALLVRANYGAGKSHLLRIVQESALKANYAVALVVTDAAGGVRFNRMDTIFGAVAKAIQVPGDDRMGIAALFDRFDQRWVEEAASSPELKALSSNGTWVPVPDGLSDPILIGLRAWILGGQTQRDLVAEWFGWPEPYRNRRSDLYRGLVLSVGHKIADKRTEARYYMDDAFSFHPKGHENAWSGLYDLDHIARLAGLRGLVLLFDEFEDVIQGLNNKAWQVAAFENLFRFFSAEAYPSMAYFAVTPDFATRCRAELLARGVEGFPLTKFEHLPAFELDPITYPDFERLAGRIASVHAAAYGWEVKTYLKSASWAPDVKVAWGSPSPDRIRSGVRQFVSTLDSRGRKA